MEINFYKAIVSYGWRYILPSVEYRHKWWYLWEISISWWKWSIVLEMWHKDWDKSNK